MPLRPPSSPEPVEAQGRIESGDAAADAPTWESPSAVTTPGTDTPVGGPSGDGSVGGTGTRQLERPEGGPPARKGRLSFLKELPALIVVAFVLALLIKSFLVQAFYIPSASMEPTLKVGDRVLVNKLAYKFHPPSRGDVIVFENPHPGQEPHRGIVSGFFHWVTEGLGFTAPADEDFIKRVIGVPGDTVEYQNGNVYVNGKALIEPYLIGPKDTRPFGPVTVRPGHLFVMGDNRTNSNDSRFDLGQIPINRVVGKAFIKIWPPGDFGGLTDGTRFG